MTRLILNILKNVAILTAIIMSATVAEATPYNIRVLNVFTPAASVEQKCMLIDSQGLIWLGTNSGISSFDGYRFTTFRSSVQTPGILPNNSVLSITEDHEGSLWIGTRNGLVRMDKQHGRFTTYHLPGEHSREIYTLYTSHDGTVWIGTDDGMTSYNPATKSFTHYNRRNTTVVETDGTRHALGSINAKSFVEDKLGRIYIGTWSKSLYRLDRKRHTMHKFDLPTDDPSIKTYMLMLDGHGRLWISTWGGGIKCLTNPDNLKSPGYTDFYHGDKNNAINYRILHDPVTHTIWACSRSGIGVLDERDIKAGFHYYNEISDTEKPYRLRNVTDICTDGKGNIWAQTYNYGTFHINTRPSLFKRTPILSADNIADRIRNIYTADGNIFWMSLAPSGTALYNRTTGRTLLNADIPALSSLPYTALNTHNTAIKPANDGSLWFANNSYGIIAVKDGTAKIYNTQNCQFVKDNFVKALLRSRRGIMFIGERHHLNWLLPDGRAFTLGMDIDVTGISEDHEGNIWVATDNCGIIRLGGDFSRPASLKRDMFNSEHGNFAVNDAFYCMEDSRHRIWATSNSGGLLRLDRKSQRFVNMKDELHWDFDRIFSIIEDVKGRLWLTADNALICLSFDKDGKPNYVTFTDENGLGKMIFMPSSCFSYGSELFFGAGNNLISLNTASMHGEDYLPALNIIISDIIIDGKRYAELDSTMQQRVSNAMPQYTRRLTIPASVGKFSVEFALLSYINMSQCKYAYCLEGYDDGWHYVDADVRHATFENIPSGKYRLRIKAADSYGRWTEMPHAVEIRVLPPWYASWWAWIIYICIVMGGIYGAILWYRDRLRTKNRLQMAVVFTNITHELLTPLTVISASADSIENEHPDLHDRTALIHNNINRLTRMLRQILEVRKAQAGKLQLKVSEGLLGDFCRETCESIMPIFSQKHLTFKHNITCTGEKAWFDSDKIEKMLYNLLSNAVKYSNEGGSISVEVGISGKAATISVEDTGIGISKDKLRHLYARFLDGDYRRMNTMGTGIGLSLVHDLVSLHHGKINCQSEVGVGTKFVITLPVDRDSYSNDEIAADTADIISQPAATSDNARQAAAAASGTGSEPGGKSAADSSTQKEYTVLLVEDNNELLLLMSSLLAPHFNVKTANNGERAQRIIERTPLDIVVTDVMMPVMDGIELTRWIKQSEDFAQLPVIMLTAKTQDDDRNEGYRVGADAYLTKPFNLDALRLRIENIIKNRERIRQRFQQQTDFDIEEQHYSSPEKIFVENVIAKIMEHITDSDYGREQLAADMCISSSSLYNKLRATTGQNITSFISSIRLKEACRILRQQPDIRINELSYRVGFSTPRYFSQCFKKEFGMVVKEYVEQMNK